MFINELEIRGNTRLMIRGTTFMKLTLTEIHQLILGTNGCGKSTLIQELSPMPPSGNDYIKNGYKSIVISHNNTEYTLKSTFSVRAGKHSLINNKTGEELNEGGTQSVQKSLIKDIFNYDQELHDVLTDQVKFTNMSIPTRREWLTRISGTNLDFAINLFNKLKRLQRDEEAVVKHLTSRLNKESDDMPSVEDLNALQTRFDNLDNKIKEFYKHRVTTDTLPPFRMFEIVKGYIDDATKHSQDILRADFSYHDKNITNIDQLHEARAGVHARIQSDNERVEELFKEHTEITNLLRETEDINDEDKLQKLKNRLETCIQETQDYKKQLAIITECDNAVEVNGRALGIQDRLIHIATEFIDNTDGYFTKERRLQTENKIEQFNIKLTNHARQIKQIEHNIDHIKRTDSTVCPECNHVFKAGISDKDLPVFQTALNELETDVINIQKLKDVEMSYMDEYTKYRNNYVEYANILHRNKDLDFINKHIKPIDLLKDSPNIIVTTLTACLRDLDKLASMQRLLPEIYKLEAAIAKVTSVRSNGNYTQERLFKIENMITDLRNRVEVNKNVVTQYNNQYDACKYVMDTYNKLKDTLSNINDAMQDTYTANKKDVIERMITKVNTDLAHVNMELNQSRNKQNIVDDVARQRDITMYKSNNFKVLVNEINPTTGLIAEYFKQFIDQFVEQMNIIINKVWEHNVELLPCDVDSNGLTYKFPLRINDKPYGPPDGSKGSNSQVSMVNFAFKIVVMVYLGLDDYPLFLDELAPDLDEKHRINIITFVRDFVESKRCSQMFLVSHYATGYGAFVNAEILILDDENLLNVPHVYNDHVIMRKDEELIEEM